MKTKKNNVDDFLVQTAFSQKSVTRAAHTVRTKGRVPLTFNERVPQLFMHGGVLFEKRQFFNF
jgi:hypothetical protein